VERAQQSTVEQKQNSGRIEPERGREDWWEKRMPERNDAIISGDSSEKKRFVVEA
jgi:hypothetical protein